MIAVSFLQIYTELLLCSQDTPVEVLDIIFNIVKKLRIVKGTQFKFRIRSYGTGVDDCIRASGIAIGSDGKIVVAEKNSQSILIFDAAGNFITKFGSKGRQNGQFKAIE